MKKRGSVKAETSLSAVELSGKVEKRGYLLKQVSTLEFYNTAALPGYTDHFYHTAKILYVETVTLFLSDQVVGLTSRFKRIKRREWTSSRDS